MHQVLADPPGEHRADTANPLVDLRPADFSDSTGCKFKLQGATLQGSTIHATNGIDFLIYGF